MSSLIVALDFDEQKSALRLVDQLDSQQCALKVGSEMYTLFGQVFVKMLIERGFRVFLDLKFHDIPHTVARACRVCADLGIWMLNVHAAGGMAMMRAARESIETFGQERPLLIAVTVLTSLTTDDLSMIGIPASVTDHVIHLASLARDAGLDGVVSSAQETALIKQTCGASFLTITPGIRLPDAYRDDQVRCMTPACARRAGSDYLVVGRPITRAVDPAGAVQEFLKDA